MSWKVEFCGVVILTRSVPTLKYSSASQSEQRMLSEVHNGQQFSARTHGRLVVTRYIGINTAISIPPSSIYDLTAQWQILPLQTKNKESRISRLDQDGACHPEQWAGANRSRRAKTRPQQNGVEPMPCVHVECLDCLGWACYGRVDSRGLWMDGWMDH
jgi:hypothetical protein